MLALSLVLPGWAAALIVAGFLLIVAAILGLAALGALVVIPLVALAAIPLLLATLFAVGGVVAFVLSVWALIEGLAAFERWIESDRRFRQ